jgi:hypothetical protein
MKTNARNRIMVSLCSTLALAGCISEGEEEGEILEDETEVETSTTEQAVSWTAVNWHSCDSQLDCSVNLGSSTNRTCFLGGIRGKLAGGSSSYPTGAKIVNNGSWGYNLYIKNPGYNDISVMSVCIGNTANRTIATWNGGSAVTIPPGPSSTRRCFLSGVYNYNSTAFSTFATNTKVWRDGNTHFLGGNLTSGSSVSVGAVCVDVPTNQGVYEYGNGTSSSYAGNLTYNPASGGVACGLTGFGGKFTTSNPGSGVIIGYNSGTRYWNWTMSPWTGGNALCVK